MPNIITYWPNFLIMTVFYAFGNVLLFKAYKTTQASEVAIILATKLIWTVITASLLFGESLGVFRIIGTFLILGSVVVLSWRDARWKLSRGHLYLLLSALFYGIAFTNDALLIQFFDVASYLSIAFIFPAFAILLYSPTSIKQVKFYLTKEHILNMAVTGVFYAMSAITIFLAFSHGGELVVLAPLLQTQIIITVLLSYIFLKERTQFWKKIIGVLLAFFGAWLMLI